MAKTTHRYDIELSYQRFIANYERNNAEILTEHLGVDASAMIEMAARKAERLVTEEVFTASKLCSASACMASLSAGSQRMMSYNCVLQTKM